MDISEIKRSCFSNSSVSSRSKDNSLDLIDTKNYKPSTAKKFTESCSLPAGLALAPALIAAPKRSTISTSDNNFKKNLNGWDSNKGNVCGTGGEKLVIHCNKYNVTSVTDLEVCKTMFSDNNQSYSNDSKLTSTLNGIKIR